MFTKVVLFFVFYFVTEERKALKYIHTYFGLLLENENSK